MPDAAKHRAAGGPHGVGRILLQVMAERVVNREKEPAVAALLDHREPGTVRERIGVVGVVNRLRAAAFVGEARGAGPVQDDDLVALLGDILGRECCGRGRDVDERVELVAIEPLGGLGAGDLRPVQVIRDQHLDRLAEDPAADILDGHPGGGPAAGPGHVRVRTGHVQNEPDLHGAIRNLICRLR